MSGKPKWTQLQVLDAKVVHLTEVNAQMAEALHDILIIYKRTGGPLAADASVDKARAALRAAGLEP